jgi:Fe-S-cluster-containing dehydrogenase component
LSEFILSVNLTLCSGCFACIVACKQENSLRPGADDPPGSQGPNWIKIHKVTGPSGDEKTEQMVFVPLMCNHCKNAPCVQGCPTRATYYDEREIVCFDEKKCIGCKYCVEVCPYQIRSFDTQKKVGSKCQLCLPRLLEGKKPRCVETCPASARSFQWIPDEEVSEKPGESEASFSLLTEAGTDPSVVYRLKLKFRGEIKK